VRLQCAIAICDCNLRLQFAIAICDLRMRTAIAIYAIAIASCACNLRLRARFAIAYAVGDLYNIFFPVWWEPCVILCDLRLHV
jgi:hypothetical protein